MKKQILFLMIIGILFSCSESENKITGSWKLIEMTSNNQNSESADNEMEWQETYQINTDGTFQKSRDTDGVTTNAIGTYNILELPDGKYLEFTYNNKSEIIGSCSSNLKEEVFFQSKNIFTSTWIACDGPSLKYKKTD